MDTYKQTKQHFIYRKYISHESRLKVQHFQVHAPWFQASFLEVFLSRTPWLRAIPWVWQASTFAFSAGALCDPANQRPLRYWKRWSLILFVEILLVLLFVLIWSRCINCYPDVINCLDNPSVRHDLHTRDQRQLKYLNLETAWCR